MNTSTTYQEAATLETSKAVVRIHVPECSPEEQEKRIKNIHNATAKFIKNARELKKWQSKKSITG